jgi:putative hydrolase
MKNPYIDAIGHPGTPQFDVDIEKVVSAAKEYRKFIEINNHSFMVRTGCDDNCRNFAIECKKQGVKIVCGSDAHISFQVGKFERVERLLEEIGMPKELVMNTKISNFNEFI